MPIVTSVINSKIRANTNRIARVKTTIMNGTGHWLDGLPETHYLNL